MSLRGDKYETAEEIRARLEGSVVMYDGSPVYIAKVDDAIDDIARVWISDLPYVGGAKTTRKFLSSKKFDLAPFKMGYFNYEGRAIFASRAPIRQYKQGLTSGTLTLQNTQGKGGEVGVSFARAIANQGFVDMIHNKYPDFKTAGDLLGDKNTSSVAVSRTFAFVIDNDIDALLLMHKFVRCGICLKGDKSLRVPEKFHFLREEMEEHRIPIS